MTYQITLNWSEEEYAAVTAAAQDSGRPVEELVREAVAQPSRSPRAASAADEPARARGISSSHRSHLESADARRGHS